MALIDQEPREATTRRQTQVLCVLHRVDTATASEIREQLASMGVDLSHAAVKSALRGLVEDGQVTARRRGRANRYRLAGGRETAARDALRTWIRTFFKGDAEAALLGFLETADTGLPSEELERLRALLAADGHDAE